MHARVLDPRADQRDLCGIAAARRAARALSATPTRVGARDAEQRDARRPGTRRASTLRQASERSTWLATWSASATRPAAAGRRRRSARPPPPAPSRQRPLSAAAWSSGARERGGERARSALADQPLDAPAGERAGLVDASRPATISSSSARSRSSTRRCPRRAAGGGSRRPSSRPPREARRRRAELRARLPTECTTRTSGAPRSGSSSPQSCEQTVTRPPGPSAPSAAATRPGRRRSRPLRSSISSGPPAPSASSVLERAAAAPTADASSQRSQRIGHGPSGLEVADLEPAGEQVDVSLDEPDARAPRRRAAARGRCLPGARRGTDRPCRSARSTSHGRLTATIQCYDGVARRRRSDRSRTAVSTIAMPATTSTTKWFAVATTATPSPPARAPRSARSSQCRVARKTTMPDEQVPAGVEARHRRVLIDQRRAARSAGSPPRRASPCRRAAGRSAAAAHGEGNSRATRP